MKNKPETILKKVTRIKDAALDLMVHQDYPVIVKKFTDVGIEIFGADFGFAWWKYNEVKKYSLIYKSFTTPYEPTLPREGAGNEIARTSKQPFFDCNVKSKNYLFDINKYMKSYMIIPIFYNNLIYGNLVLCFKKKQTFGADQLDLATILGNTAAQTITIQQSHEKAEHLKTTANLLIHEKLKTDFWANATHELRTPVAIIKGNVDLGLLNKGKNQKSAKSVLRAIDIETEHLSKILSDLSLISSRKEDLKHKLISEKIDLHNLIQNVINRFKVLAQKKKISIVYSKTAPIIFTGDKTHIEKMLANLIKNSILYGNMSGHTWVSMSVSKKGIEICVEDDGIGIATVDIPYVFDRFYKADKSHQSDDNSTGLGLAIVKWVAEIHGGSVSVKKVPKGTLFKVILPTNKLKRSR